jgi:hypothetical protein
MKPPTKWSVRGAVHKRHHLTGKCAVLGILCYVSTPAQAAQIYTLSGVGGGLKSLESYQGIIYSPTGGLSESGPILRLWNKAFRFTYRTDLPTARNVTISALGLSFEGEAGWQFVGKPGRIAFYGGIVWRDHFLTPSDPGANLTKARLGFSATLDGAYTISDDFSIMANASFLQGFNQYWIQIKPYTPMRRSGQSNQWKLGLDMAGFGGKNYHTVRFGLFTSDFEFALWKNKKVYLGVQAGVQYAIKAKAISPYAGLNAGFLFSY